MNKFLDRLSLYFAGRKRMKNILQKLEAENKYLRKSKNRNYRSAKIMAFLNDEILLGSWCIACPETGCEHKFVIS